jgi:hypothetical protein
MRPFSPLSSSNIYPRFWRAAIVCVAVLSLMAVLANRFHYFPTDVPGIHSDSKAGKVQHVADDAYQWSAPVATFSLPQFSRPTHQAIVEYVVILPMQVDQPLSNRPPPVS